jgi:hypothetical protein
MARDPRTNPLNILTESLTPAEEGRVIIEGARLCPEFRMSGPVFAPVLIGHAITHAALGGTWVPGIWAVTNLNLRYVSRRSWFGWHGGQAFDIKVPLHFLIDLGLHKAVAWGTPLGRGVRCKISYQGGAFSMWARQGES